MLVLVINSMKASHLILGTQRETPSDAEVISHQLMIRAGLISKCLQEFITGFQLEKKFCKKLKILFVMK